MGEDKAKLIDMLRTQHVQAEVMVVDPEAGYLPLWATSDDAQAGDQQRQQLRLAPTKTSNSGPEESSESPIDPKIVIIGFLIAIAVLGVVGVICVKQKQSGFGSKSEP